jgi:hypothetical protein
MVVCCQSARWYINRIDSGTDLGGCADYFVGKTCRPAKRTAARLKCLGITVNVLNYIHWGLEAPLVFLQMYQ